MHLSESMFADAPSGRWPVARKRTAPVCRAAPVVSTDAQCRYGAALNHFRVQAGGPRLFYSEFTHDGFGPARKDARVDRDGGEERADLDAALREPGVRGQDACGFPGRPQAADRILDRGDDVGMTGFSDMSKAGCEIGGSDEDPVDAFDRGNRLERV